jgi:hypothetical protein
MKKYQKLLTFFLCLLVFVSISTPYSFADELCSVKTLESELQSELEPETNVADILAPLALLASPLLIQQNTLSIPSIETLRLNDLEGLRTSGISHPAI